MPDLSYPLARLQIAQSWNGSPVAAAEQVQLELELRPNGLLIDFWAPHYGDPLPAPPAGSTPELWEYEVVEVFVAHGERYTEIELGPAGHYLVLCLQGYRQRLSEGHPIRYKTYLSPGQWMGTALVPLELLPPQPWQVNAYAIHGKGSTRRYLAAYAPGGVTPDFHQLQAFQPLQFS